VEAGREELHAHCRTSPHAFSRKRNPPRKLSPFLQQEMLGVFHPALIEDDVDLSLYSHLLGNYSTREPHESSSGPP